MAETLHEADDATKSPPKLRVKIKKWHSVATWTWGVEDGDCTICRQPFDGCCSNCKFPGDDCAPVWGGCGHPFHMHCILKWLQSQNGQEQCPLCRQEWKFK